MAEPTSNKQTRLIIILILFFGAIGGYVYYSNFSSVDDQGIPPIVADSKDTLTQFKNINFNFQALNSPSLKVLKIFGDSPVKPDLTGKINPFASF